MNTTAATIVNCDNSETAGCTDCICGCIYRCPCGEPCQRCYSNQQPPVLSTLPTVPLAADMIAIDDERQREEESNDSAAQPTSATISSPSPSPSSRYLSDEEVSWEEQLFRRQFHGSSITTHLAHLSAHLPRVTPLYAVYFYFRTRGYLLHSGAKLGVDYVAYPAAGGAERWHAQFAILVGEIESDNDATAASTPPSNATFQHVLRTMHICVKQKKTCLYARVFSSQPIQTPSSSSIAALVNSSTTSSSVTSTSSATAVTSAADFSHLSVSLIRLMNWFVTKGRGWDQQSLAQQQAQRKHKQQQHQQLKQHQANKKQKTSATTARNLISQVASTNDANSNPSEE